MFSDVLYALRTMRRSPAFFTVAVLSLALGIGANTAIFTLLDQVLLRSLPLPEPDRLVVIQSPGYKTGHVNSDETGSVGAFSHPMFRDLAARQTVFTGLAGRYAIPVSVSAAGATDRANGELASGNYFETLGVKPVLGRTFAADDDRTPGAHPVAVLSHGYWKRRFGGSTGVLNSTILLNNRSFTVIGVAAPGFEGVQIGLRTDVWVPLMMKAEMTPNWNGLENRFDYWMNIVGRLQPGVSRQQAQAAMAPLYRRLLEGEWDSKRIPSDKREKFVGKPLVVAEGSQGRRILQNDAGEGILMLMGMVGLVLLIACANVANLLTARSAARQKEIAVRLAMGAGRGRLIRQLLVESLLLALLGGAAALLVATWTADLLVSAMPRDAFEGITGNLDPRVLGFNFLLALCTGLLFGLLPALRATRPDLAPVLKDQAGNVSVGGAQVRLRKGLVVAQMALTLVLLVAAGLFARSLQNLRGVDLGVQPDRLIGFAVAPELNGYNPERTAQFVTGLAGVLAALPGVEIVAASEIGAFEGNTMSSNVTIEGYPATEDEDMNLHRNFVTPRYFAAMGTPLLAGREFDERDTARSPQVCIISEAVAKKHFAGRNPIGMKIAIGSGDKIKPDIEIVGVARDARHNSVRFDPARFLFQPYTQRKTLGNMTFYVRTRSAELEIAPALRAAVARLDANLPIYDLRTLESRILESVFAERLITGLAIAFGLLAALLAAVGTYGVMAYTVARRVREIGIRMALGANSRNVQRLILGEVGLMAVLGAAAGLPAAYGLTKLVESLLYGVKGGDLATMAAATVAMLGVALAAGYLPARRATRVDPMVALRYE